MKSIRNPYPHQLEAVSFLLSKKRAILADEMGLGKTFSSILAMERIRGRKLIVCPASLKLNWEKEIKRAFPSADVVILNGKKLKKLTTNSWVIVNYDVLKTYMDPFKVAKFSVVTFDEVHYCKSINNNGHGGSKRARYFIQLSNQIEHVFCLTGTPIPSKTKDIFNLLKAIKHPLSRGYKAFAQRYCNPTKTGYGWSYEGSSNQAELYELLQPFMLRRLKEQVLQLPDKIRSFIPVDISLSNYDQQLRDYLQNASSLKTRGQHLAQLNMMRHGLADAKVKHTLSLVRDSLELGEPVIVFTNFDSVVEELRSSLQNVGVITGKQTTLEREKAVELFQSGKKNVLICNLLAGGVGLTLTKANRIIVNDFDWVPANHLQAEDRIHRIGQSRHCVIEYMYAPDSMDEKMAFMLEDKLRNINLIIDAKEEGFLDEVISWLMTSSQNKLLVT